MLLSGLLTWMAVPSATAAPGIPPAVRTLLGAEPTTAPEWRADIVRLQAGRATWQADPLSRLVVLRRLAIDFQRLQRPDSAYRYWLLARRETGSLRRAYPFETSDVWFSLGMHHFSALALDSAGYYMRAAADQLAASGLNLHADTELAVVFGGRQVPGRALASHYANAGLVYRRRGELTAALQLYERALQLQRALHDEPGLRWTQCLLGEAYEDQGNAARALAYYTQAVGTLRTIVTKNEPEAAGQLNDVLDYAADLLLAHRRYAQLHAWAREALSYVLHSQQRDPTLNGFATQAAQLHLHQAAAFLQQRQFDSATLALQQADAQLSRLFELGNRVGPAEYFDERLAWHCLRARLAHAQRRPTARYRQEAVAAFRAIESPLRLARARERLGATLIELGDGVGAAALVQPLAPLYRRQGARLKVRDTYQLLRAAYARQQRWDSAFTYAERYRQLSDTLRAADQYAALASVETRYRTREQAQQITRLNESAERQRRQQQLIIVGVLALVLILAGVAWAWRRTRVLNRRLAELDHLKDQFFANVSHELRTPLTLLVGPAEHLLTDPTSGLPPPARQQLGLMLRNGLHLQQLVNSLLDFTKLEAGRLRPTLAPVQLPLLLRQIVGSFEMLAESRRITLSCDDGALPPGLILQLDADKLNQIVSNLLSNALKFTPPGGQVRVVAQPAGPATWGIAVADSGPGIAPAEQPRVFERFYQTKQRHASGGTGIGLALARELAELLGGTLTLESQLMAGSTFTFTFPAVVQNGPVRARAGGEDVQSVSDESEEANEALITEAADPSFFFLNSSLGATPRPRILIVEDHADLRAFLRQVLEPRYEILEAENGQVALALLATESVDLISSDEMMPLLSGTELFAALKGQARWRRAPFLLLTARADPQHKLVALELGVDDYLQKPFAPRELLARIHNLLTNYRERQQYAAEEAGSGESAASDAALAAATAVGPAATTSQLAPGSPLLASTHLTVADQNLLLRLREVVEAELANPAFDAPGLTERLHLSERTLYRKLKELTGLTPAAYVREVRLDRARRLLEAHTTQTVAEVAFAVGFDDPQYFARVFYKRFGKRATEYLRG